MSYVATVEGKYYVTAGQNRLEYRPYKLRFRLNSAEKPLSDIVKYLLDSSLKKKYPDSEGFVTHNLEGIYNEQDPEDVLDIPILFMDHDQLERYCKLRKLAFVDIDRNVDIGRCRIEVEAAAHDGQKVYADLIAKRVESSKRRAEVLAGGAMIEDDEPEKPLTAQPLKAAPQPQKTKTSSKTASKPQIQAKGLTGKDDYTNGLTGTGMGSVDVGEPVEGFEL